VSLLEQRQRIGKLPGLNVKLGQVTVGFVTLGIEGMSFTELLAGHSLLSVVQQGRSKIGASFGPIGLQLNCDLELFYRFAGFGQGRVDQAEKLMDGRTGGGIG
jgi:hypothetical protein